MGSQRALQARLVDMRTELYRAQLRSKELQLREENAVISRRLVNNQEQRVLRARDRAAESARRRAGQQQHREQQRRRREVSRPWRFRNRLEEDYHADLRHVARRHDLRQEAENELLRWRISADTLCAAVAELQRHPLGPRDVVSRLLGRPASLSALGWLATMSLRDAEREARDAQRLDASRRFYITDGVDE